MTSFFSASDVPDLQALIGEALALKADPLAFRSLGRDKTLGLLFMNPSLSERIQSDIHISFVVLDRSNRKSQRLPDGFGN
jgi:hypothetical protein